MKSMTTVTSLFYWVRPINSEANTGKPESPSRVENSWNYFHPYLWSIDTDLGARSEIQEHLSKQTVHAH